MARQLAPWVGAPRLAALDRRLAELEARLALVTEAVLLLVHELADSPRAPGGGGSAVGAGEAGAAGQRRHEAEPPPAAGPGQATPVTAVQRAGQLLRESQRRP